MAAVGDENLGCSANFDDWDFTSKVIDCFVKFNHPRAKCDNLVPDKSIWASHWNPRKYFGREI